MKKSQIAVIDDEPLMTEALKSLLEDKIQCAVEVFNDPNQALSRLKVKSFDAISIDHRMPGLTGMEIVRLLRTSEGPNAHTRILLLSGFREEAECAYNELLSEVVFLDKPAKSEDYIRWMNVMLNPKKRA